MPLDELTVTSTVPAPAAGEVTVTSLGETTTRPVPGTEPKLTALAPAKLVPVMVTVVPPANGPATGLMAATVGAPW